MEKSAQSNHSLSGAFAQSTDSRKKKENSDYSERMRKLNSPMVQDTFTRV